MLIVFWVFCVGLIDFAVDFCCPYQFMPSDCLEDRLRNDL